MVKFAAVISIFMASTLIGIYKSSEIRKRKEILLGFKELILQIEIEIKYFREPLPEIFLKLSNTYNPDSRNMMEECLRLYQSGTNNLSDNWKVSVKQVYSCYKITREDLSIMGKAGDFMGQSDFDNQSLQFELLNRQLDCQISEAEQWINTKGKMYSKMGMAIGIVIGIIVL